jgi:hypothetical protein
VGAMAVKIVLRYALVFLIVAIVMIFLKHAASDYDNQMRLKRWRSILRDRFVPYLTEVRYVENSPNAFSFSSNQSVIGDSGLLEYARARIAQPRDQKDIFELGMRLRALKGYLDSNAHNPFFPYKSHLNSSSYGSMYELLEREHFGWALKEYASLFDLRKSFKPGRCIVIPTGKEYFRFAVHIIRTVREVFKSTIPIYVYYMGKNDLDKMHMDHLKRHLGVECLDITKIFDNSILQLKGWDIKPFAMLAAPYEEILLMDADTVFMQPPDVFFSDVGYRKDGALFFHDRTLFPTDHYKKAWVQGMFGKPYSDRLRSLRFYQMKTSYEQEAGVVLIDKKRHFAGLLSVCRLNVPPEREDVFHVETHGDKETFWIGFELVQESYSFMSSLPGSLGRIQPDFETNEPAICGKLAHFDRNGTLLWFNDSIADNKKDEEWARSVSEFTHFAREGRWTPYLCLHAAKVPLDSDQLETIKKLVSVFDPDPLK